MNMNATFDIVARTLVLDEPPTGTSTTLTARLKRHGFVVPLTGVRFGLTLKANGEVVARHSWPQPNVRYVQTDQDTLASYPISWPTDSAVTLDIWLVDALGVRHTASAEWESGTAPDPVPPPDPDPLPPPDPGGNDTIPSNVSI
jgi:hypothetical protein